MTVKECYEAFGGNYKDAFSRLRSDDRLLKFLNKATEDGSFKLLTDSLSSHNLEEAFRAVHTMKGICLNLSITSLGNSSQILTEALRNREQYGDDLIPLYENVKKDYEDFVLSVKKMQE